MGKRLNDDLNHKRAEVTTFDTPPVTLQNLYRSSVIYMAQGRFVKAEYRDGRKFFICSCLDRV